MSNRPHPPHKLCDTQNSGEVMPKKTLEEFTAEAKAEIEALTEGQQSPGVMEAFAILNRLDESGVDAYAAHVDHTVYFTSSNTTRG